MSKRKITINCLFCNTEFDTTLRWEGIPEKEYCSLACQDQDEDFADEVTFEKFTRGGKDEWR